MNESLSVDSPVVLARLRRAREDRGLAQGPVAQALGVARTTLVAIEKGERRLLPAELVALADLYGERLDTLLRPAPEPRPLAAQFRTAVGRMPEEVELRQATAELQRLGEDYVELERLLEAPPAVRHPPAQDIGSGDLETQAAMLADAERGRLRLGDGPLPHLREILENDVGLRVFAMPLPSRIGGLFGFDEQLGACVAVNARQRWERQRWSLAHEYAHFLTRRDRPEVTVVLSSYRRVPASERFADAFARHFLMPTSGIERRFRSIAVDGGKPTIGTLLQQADWWGVSFQAYLLRLEGLRLVRPGLWDRYQRRGFKVAEGRALLDLPEREPDARLLPRRYRLLAVTAYGQELLSEERLAHLLREDRLGARMAVAELIEPAGEAG